MRWFPLLLLLIACSDKGRPNGTQPSVKPPESITIFYTTELKGSIEPCGCTSDPLGDLARTTKIVQDARAGSKHVFFMDGGSNLYTEPKIAPRAAGQEELKSTLITQVLANELNASAVGIGPYDLAHPTKTISPPRMAVNIENSERLPIQAPSILSAGSSKLGVFGVVSPNALSSTGIPTSFAKEAAQKAVAQLKKDGATTIIALAHMTFDESRTLARDVKEIDFILVGQNAPEDEDDFSELAKQVGETWLIQPGSKGQLVSRLDLFSSDAKGPFVDAIGKHRATLDIERISADIETIQSNLSKWKTDANADKSFVATKEKELVTLKADKKSLESNPLAAPKEGAYFTLEQIRISKALSCDESIVKKKQDYDKQSGIANVKAAADEKPLPTKRGEAHYVGIEECSFCHKEAVDMWKSTKHEGAWETLEGLGKEFNYDCIGCHVTGWNKPGGSNLSHNDEFRDVQCEVCHGPGSLHVDADGKEKISTIVKTPTEDLCVGCHSKEHSDTFDFQAYLRDVTGKGHGEAFRATLGSGATGHELRSAALKKAGLTIGADCPK